MQVGLNFEYDLKAVATGGTPPYKFDIVEGSLPDGLDLSTEGYLAGTPTREGHTRVAIGLYDSAGGEVTQGFDCFVQE